MCCLKPIVTGVVGRWAPLQAALEKLTSTGRASAKAPLASVPPSVASAASPAVLVTVAVVERGVVLAEPRA